MLRLRGCGRPPPSRGGGDPNLHGVQSERPGDPVERSDGGPAGGDQRNHHAAAGHQHVADRRRVCEESELRVVQVPEHNDGAVLPRRRDRGGAWAAGEIKGAADGEDEHNRGRDNGSDPVAAGSRVRYQLGYADVGQLHGGWRESKDLDDHEAREGEDELQHDC